MNLRVWAAAFATAAAMLPGVAAAQTAIASDWACWYEGRAMVNCMLVRASSRVPEASAQPARIRLPALAGEIQRSGPGLYGRLVEIPLISEPDDGALMQQLAHFTVCGTAADCRMTFLRSRRELVLLKPER